MKKIILTFFAVTVVIASHAYQNPFERVQTKKSDQAKLAAKYKVPFANSSNVNVPTLTKNSDWDNLSSNWSPNFAVRYNYSNNRLTTETQVSYSLNDTFARYVYTYDNNGRYALVEYQNFDPVSHTFTNNGRMTYTHGNYGSYSTLIEQYDLGSNAWLPAYRLTQLYDNHYRNIKYSYEIYNNGVWSLVMGYSSKITYYNNTEKIIEQVDSNFNSSTMMMEAEYKTTRTYNSNGQVLSMLNYEYDNGNAVLIEVDSVKYDNAGVAISLTMYDNITMDPVYRLDNINWNGSFNQNIDLFDNQPFAYQESAFFNLAWVPVGRFSTLFPDNFGSVVRLDEEYVNNTYIPLYRRSQINDSHLNLIEESEEEYDDLTMTWNTQYGNKYTNQYDISGNITEQINKQYSFNDSAYVNSRKLEFSGFISITSGVNNIKTIETKLFPNPSSNGSVAVNVKMEAASDLTIKILDLKGSIVYSQVENLGSGLNTIQLKNLKQGMYIVELSTDFGVSRTKLIVN